MSGPADITVHQDGIEGTFHVRFSLSHLGTRHVSIFTDRHPRTSTSRLDGQLPRRRPRRYVPSRPPATTHPSSTSSVTTLT
jgi:hypothetical protein